MLARVLHRSIRRSGAAGVEQYLAAVIQPLLQTNKKLRQALQSARQANGFLKEKDGIEFAPIEDKDICLIDVVQAAALHQVDQGWFDVNRDHFQASFPKQETMSSGTCSDVQNPAFA